MKDEYETAADLSTAIAALEIIANGSATDAVQVAKNALAAIGDPVESAPVHTDYSTALNMAGCDIPVLCVK